MFFDHNDVSFKERERERERGERAQEKSVTKRNPF